MSVFEFSYGDRKYRLELNSKINILTGSSGSGKTALCDDVLNANNIQDTGITVILDYGVDLSLYNNNSLLIIDEGVLNKYISNNHVEALNKGFNHLLIISRDSLKSLSYSYKDIYELKLVEGIKVLERVYPNFNMLNFVPEYVEDKGAGFKYYKQYYSNIKSAKGKDNIRKLPEGSNIIADGCAIGSSIRLLYGKYQMFLPESFEWLLLRKELNNNAYDFSWKPEQNYYDIAHSKLGVTKNSLSNKCKSRKYISDFEVPDNVLEKYLNDFECDCSVMELRDIIYNICGDYNTDTVIKMAIVLHTLNRL